MIKRFAIYDSVHMSHRDYDNDNDIFCLIRNWYVIKWNILKIWFAIHDRSHMSHYDYDVMIMFWFFYSVLITKSYVIGKWLIIWVVICYILIIWFTLQTYTIWLTATIAKWLRNDFPVSHAVHKHAAMIT